MRIKRQFCNPWGGCNNGPKESSTIEEVSMSTTEIPSSTSKITKQPKKKPIKKVKYFLRG